jgi:hypothetical protein
VIRQRGCWPKPDSRPDPLQQDAEHRLRSHVQPFSFAPSSPATAAPQGYSVDPCRTVADQFKEQLKFPDLKGSVCHGQLGEPFLALALRRDDSNFRLAVDTALSHIYRPG